MKEKPSCLIQGQLVQNRVVIFLSVISPVSVLLKILDHPCVFHTKHLTLDQSDSTHLQLGGDFNLLNTQHVSIHAPIQLEAYFTAEKISALMFCWVCIFLQTIHRELCLPISHCHGVPARKWFDMDGDDQRRVFWTWRLG